MLATTLAPSFEAPLELLLACHEKVRHFCALSLKLNDHMSEQGADDAARTAALSILRYFDIAAPLHHADEDDDLFPLLYALQDTQLKQQLDALALEHQQLNLLWQTIRPWLLAAAAGDALHAPPELAQFAHAYPQHTRQEELRIYPACAHLPSQLLSQCGERMRQRRGADTASQSKSSASPIFSS